MYNIQLPNFEGPLDLLLFFIKRDELDIHDIPISRITSEFLAYTRLIELLDLELAGEFLVMASILMQIKAKMLLPKTENPDENAEDEIDPRAELVRRLLEYKRYKEAAGYLSSKADVIQYRFYRQFFDSDAKAEPISAEEEFTQVQIYDLINAFSKVLNKIPKQPTTHTILREPLTIEEQINTILVLLEQQEELHFSAVLRSADRAILVITFLAILELVRNNQVVFRQDEQFGEIILCRRNPPFEIHQENDERETV